MLSRNLGQSGISVSAIGLGCMGLSEFYGEPAQESEAINLLRRAVDLGITHFDTAEQNGCQILNCELNIESINIIHYSRFDTGYKGGSF